MTPEKIAIIKEIKTEMQNTVKKVRASNKSIGTTYLNADSKDGRLVVDFTLRRGAHHVSIVANSYTSSRFNLSLFP